MIRVFHSNRTEILLATLATDLRVWRAEAGPFEPECLVVPNRSVETYVRFGLATTNGFAGNIDSFYLRPFVRALLDDPDTRLLDGQALLGFVLSTLLDGPALESPELARVRDYIFRDGARDDRGVEARRFQLARQVAHLFEEYAYSRREMLERWPDAPLFADQPGADEERWQRALWLRTLELAEARRRETGFRWLPLHAVIDRVRAGRVNLPRRISLFGLSHVAPMFHRLFRELGKRTEVVSYTLNPCAEFWEDVSRGPRAGAGVEDAFAPRTMPALRLWGRPGAENVKQWNEMVGQSPENRSLDRSGEALKLLERFQQDVLRPSEATGTPCEKDESLRILACKSIRREAEAIASDVWALVQADEERRRDPAHAQDPPLRFNDIAVIVPPRDSERYFTHLAAALGEAHEIPCNIVDMPFVATSRVADAIRLLLELPLSRFTRADVLRLLTHPVVIARYPDAEAARWIDWSDRLGILHGADHEDHRGTYIDADILNWDQGLRRLALGAFLPGARSGVEKPLRLPAGEYLPEETSQSSQVGAAQFGLLARSLIQDARFARAARLTPADWSAFLQDLIETYVQAPAPADERDRGRCTRALRQAFELQLDGEITFHTAQALALDALDGISGARGQHLAHGVVLSTAQPMRAVPFRVVFLAGLGEGRFPSSDRPSPLDLRRLTHQPGDVSPAEQDRYLFLEALLVARDAVRLSYVSRDPLTGDPLEPSSVVCELLEILHAGYLGPPDSHDKALWSASLLVEDQPVWRQLDAVKILPAALAEADSFALRNDWKKRFGAAAVPATAEALKPHVAPARWESLGTRLALCPPAPPVAAQEEPPLYLTLSRLRRFLECPLQGHAAAVLRLAEEEEDALELEDEPFATDRLRATTLVTNAFLQAFQEAGGKPRPEIFERVLDGRMKLEALAGRAPAGVFRESERAAQLAVIKTWADRLGVYLGATKGRPAFRKIRLGRADVPAEIKKTIPPLILDVRTREGRQRRVEISGTTQPMLADRPESILLQWRGPRKGETNQSVDRQKRLLRAFVDYVVLRAAGERDDSLSAFLAITDGETTDSRVARFAPLSKAAAGDYLRGLVEDLIGSPHEYLLPCEAVFAAGGEKHADYSHTPKQTSSRWGPVRHPESYAPPSNAAARDMVERRFRLFFDLLEMEEKGAGG